MTDNKHKNLTEAVRAVIDGLPIGAEFTGWQLYNMVKKIYTLARWTLPDVTMRRMRDYRNSYGTRKVACINKHRSVYRKVQK